MKNPVIQAVNAIMQKRFPYGGLNLVKAHQAVKEINQIDNNDTASAILKQQLKLAVELSDAGLPLFFGLIDGTQYEELKGLFCGQLAVYAMREIIQKFPETPVEIVMLDHHTLIVINRSPHSDPKNCLTWGKTATLYSPWVGLEFAASEFYSQRDKALEVLFSKTIKNVENNTIVEKQVLSQGHEYLAGNPQISYQVTLKTLQNLEEYDLYNSRLQQYTQDLYNQYDVTDVNACLIKAILNLDLNAINCFLLNPELKINQFYLSSDHTALDIANKKKLMLSANNGPQENLVKILTIIKRLEKHYAQTAQQIIDNLINTYKSPNINICLRRAVAQDATADVELILKIKDLNINDISPQTKITALDIAHEKAQQSPKLSSHLITLLQQNGAKTAKEIQANANPNPPNPNDKRIPTPNT